MIQNPSPDPESLIEIGRSVVQTESEAVGKLADRIDASFVQACELILNCEGRVVVVGIGERVSYGRI